MTIQTLVYIIIWFIVSLVLISGYVLIYFYGKWKVKNDFNKAMIFVKNGKEICKPLKGKLAGKTKAGYRYDYKNNTVFVPRDYEEHYYRNHRAIYVNRIGQLIASPFDKDVQLSDNEKNDLIYELTASSIGSDAIKALKGKFSFNVILVAGIAFVIGVAVVFGYQYMQKATTTQQPAITQPVKPPVELTPPIEVK